MVARSDRVDRLSGKEIRQYQHDKIKDDAAKDIADGHAELATEGHRERGHELRQRRGKRQQHRASPRTAELEPFSDLTREAADQDPGAEEIYRNYIIRLLSIGDQKRALDIYERCLEALTRTPQRAPSPELQKLYEQLQADLKNSGIGH